MKITTTTGLVGFLLALSAFNAPQAQAKIDSPSTIEQRLARLSATIKEQENQLPEAAKTELDNQVAGAWGNGRGRGWVDGRGGRGWGDGRSGSGWVNGRGGGAWVNRRNWGDGGSFWNRR